MSETETTENEQASRTGDGGQNPPAEPAGAAAQAGSDEKGAEDARPTTAAAEPRGPSEDERITISITLGRGEESGLVMIRGGGSGPTILGPEPIGRDRLGEALAALLTRFKTLRTEEVTRTKAGKRSASKGAPARKTVPDKKPAPPPAPAKPQLALI